jgi:large subunit ribosomal protein L10
LSEVAFWIKFAIFIFKFAQYGDIQVNREEKAQLLAELQEMFNNSGSVVISHYKGLTVAEVSKLRDDIRKAGASFRVTKNRITRLALKDTKFADLADLMTGPTAIAFANDPISACKACVEFSKTNEKLVVLGGANTTGVLSIDDIKRLASLPSMDELRAQIIGLLQAPASKLARVTRAYSEKEAA